MEERTTIQVSSSLRKELKALAARKDENYQELLSDMIEVFNELDENRTIVSIPKKLFDRAKEKIKETGFNNVSEYMTFILRLIMYENASKEKIDEKKIKDKLKLLGYI